MFCKICRDAGRTDYTTHNVRGPGGKLTCKYLAQINCRFCGEKGHTQQYCSQMARKLKAELDAEKRNIRQSLNLSSKKIVFSMPVISNSFKGLEFSDDSDDGSDDSCSECDDVVVQTDNGRTYDEEDMENARKCDVDFSTIPLEWGKMPVWN